MALEECKFECVPDDTSVKLDHITKGALPRSTPRTHSTWIATRCGTRKVGSLGGLQLGTGRPMQLCCVKQTRRCLRCFPRASPSRHAACRLVRSTVGSASSRHFHGGCTSAARVHPDGILAVRVQERSVGAVQREFLLPRQFRALHDRVRGFSDQST